MTTAQGHLRLVTARRGVTGTVSGRDGGVEVGSGDARQEGEGGGEGGPKLIMVLHNLLFFVLHDEEGCPCLRVGSAEAYEVSPVMGASSQRDAPASLRRGKPTAVECSSQKRRVRPWLMGQVTKPCENHGCNQGSLSPIIHCMSTS